MRELGLLYIDCVGQAKRESRRFHEVFMLFSEKYVLTDIYCKPGA